MGRYFEILSCGLSGVALRSLGEVGAKPEASGEAGYAFKIGRSKFAVCSAPYRLAGSFLVAALTPMSVTPTQRSLLPNRSKQ